MFTLFERQNTSTLACNQNMFLLISEQKSTHDTHVDWLWYHVDAFCQVHT